MRELMDTDTDYYTSKKSIVYDINVYYNGDDDFPDNLFNAQLKRYYDDCCRYADEVYAVCKEIKDSGSNYTDNVAYYKSRYSNFNDRSYKWVNKDKEFGHVILEFKVQSTVGIDLGSKLTGRWGNKGVVSSIVNDTHSANTNLINSIVNMVDNGHMTEEEKNSLKMNITFVEDERMPYYIQDGKKVYADILLNSSGAIRRLNPGQLVEVEFNFIAEQVQYMIHKAETFEEKEAITFKFIECVNKDMNTFFRDIYDSYDETKSINGVSIRFKSDEYKEAFIRDVEENGFYIVRPPHKPLLFDDIIRLYDEFPEIKPVDIYVDLFGTKQRKTMRKGVLVINIC